MKQYLITAFAILIFSLSVTSTTALISSLNKSVSNQAAVAAAKPLSSQEKFDIFLNKYTKKIEGKSVFDGQSLWNFISTNIDTNGDCKISRNELFSYIRDILKINISGFEENLVNLYINNAVGNIDNIDETQFKQLLVENRSKLNNYFRNPSKATPYFEEYIDVESGPGCKVVQVRVVDQQGKPIYLNGTDKASADISIIHDAITSKSYSKYSLDKEYYFNIGEML